MNAKFSGNGLSPAPFEAVVHPRLVFAAGAVEEVATWAGRLGGRRVLVVTDAGLVRAGHVGRAVDRLERAGLPTRVFDGVHENPTTRDVAECLDVARQHAVDLLIGLGGGSAMDTAKGVNFLLTNGGRMQDYWGVGKATRPMLPMLAIPTTAGTGSECQSAALIADEVTHQKMACLDTKAAARVALLDPVLTLSQPARVTACTGIDALSHAVESAVTRKRSVFSGLYSREAFRLCVQALPEVMRRPEDLGARGAMLLGAAFAGIAIENSMLGAAHAAANPVTARNELAHGWAVGLMLPHVVRWNAEEEATRLVYAELAVAGGLSPSDASPESSCRRLVDELERLLEMAGAPSSLAACGVTEDLIPVLAAEAARQWTAQHNPRPAGVEDFVRLYTSALGGPGGD